MEDLEDKEIQIIWKRKISKVRRLGHVVLALSTTYLVAYNPNIKFPKIIYIVQNEVLYVFNNMRL